ncbi:zinc metalloproteinase-disintegrin-like jararhagin [Pholidichthys leucotaenia]
MLPHVQRYEVVRPQRRQERQKRSLQDQQLYPDTVQYKLTVEGRNHTIHLEKNRNLIGRDYTETYYTEDGKRVTASPSQDHCYYHGHIEGMEDSSVSVGICSGISGFLRARQQVYLIEPLGQTDSGDHAIYKREYLRISGRPSCGSSSNTTTVLYDHKRDQDQGPRMAGLFRPRSWKIQFATGPQRFVELFVVVDNTEYKRYGSETKSRILGAMNHVDKLYRPLNIRILLVGLEIWSYQDQIVVHPNSDTTLDNFLAWRRSDLMKRTKHDNAQFVTGIDFIGDTVGVANKFAMCTEHSGGVNQDHHNNLIGLASTIAHEMGHNFGLSHDKSDCMCGLSKDCVMTEKLRTEGQPFPELFSNCSMQQLTEFMERAQPSCLHNPGSIKTISEGPRCGNALLDPGEECDCGTVEECKNPCCDASTCHLTAGSQCAHGECCDRCQLKPSGSVCRQSVSECDLTEYCTGRLQDCPEDSFEMNGKPCYQQAKGYCYNGQCPTNEHHCWRLFGKGAQDAPDVCYKLNQRGLESANCGRDKSGIIRCAVPNVRCGSIFCVGGNESITGKAVSYTTYGRECKAAVDDDKMRNLNMVPKGSSCGPDKVCLGNKCVDVSVYGKREDCGKKCNNNGVCNHRTECHCNPGWAPPYCEKQYEGVSEAGQTGLIAGVCASLSVLLVITLVIVGLMCCKRDNVDCCVSKRKVHSAQLYPMFKQEDVGERPQISPPTFMASTATQACSPLIVTVTPSRPAPQPPKKVSSMSETSETEPQTTPLPPSKPLPPLNKPQYKAAKPNPPLVPPVKPSPLPPVRSGPPPVPPAKPHVQRLT